MRIAFLEDDADQAKLITAWLEDADHNVVHYDSGRAFLRGVRRESFDLLILDWLVPDLNGIEVLREIREGASDFTPALFVTVRGNEASIVEGLEAGADDYMTKPLRQFEFTARVSALLRRSKGHRADELDVAPYQVDVNQRRIVLDDEEIEFTERELDLALFLFKNAGSVVSRSHILETIWGLDSRNLSTRTIDTYVSRLRKKLRVADTGWKLSGIYQHGYRLERLPDATEESLESSDE